ncbi:MAG: hypothetical protein ACYC5J_08380 [Chloroflexota bacterium]
MQTPKIYLRPSARPLLEAAPAGVATLLARYLKLLEGYAQGQGVQVSRTEVAGYQEEDGSRGLMITHRVRLSPDETRVYRSHLGTEIQNWVSGLSREEVDLVQEWFILEVKSEE